MFSGSLTVDFQRRTLFEGDTQLIRTRSEILVKLVHKSGAPPQKKLFYVGTSDTYRKQCIFKGFKK